MCRFVYPPPGQMITADLFVLPPEGMNTVSVGLVTLATMRFPAPSRICSSGMVSVFGVEEELLRGRLLRWQGY